MTRRGQGRRVSRRALAGVLVLSGSLLLAGCGGSTDSGASGDSGGSDGSKPELTVSGGYLPVPASDHMAGGFLTVTNDGGTADRLLSASSDIAGEVQIHETVDQKMKHVKSLEVPANGELRLQRGGNHLMFLELEKKPELGQKVALSLKFAESGTVETQLEVKEATYNPKAE
ncbi:copper chaperone PCu(A)C [Streptomyces triticagri]|uniref:Copper chaperone PCu(A)C n=1 Tax=Streptomyces triticagri TaxID=2293568 RepID=A0A372LX28_9ACTN|nr:copper chaperone PCu(A)C [Streptomyces triticagri]RFU83206.1 copper chaperone PCu(A)C [Streptomyces triticagri]